MLGRTAAAPRPSYNVLDKGAEQSTWRCRRCGGSTVEQARPHLTEQAGYAGERGRLPDKTRATSSSGQVGRYDGATHSPVRKLQSFRSTRALSRVAGTRHSQRWRNCRSWMMVRCRCCDNHFIPTTVTY